MATFTVDGIEYELVTLDSLQDFTLGDLRVLTNEGGVSLARLASGDVEITTELLLALVLLSMRRVKPDAALHDAEKVNLSVLEAIAGEEASPAESESVPPTMAAAAAGHQPSARSSPD